MACPVQSLMLALLGFRVVAVSLLPVGKDTIIYGSSDGGYNVHAKNPEFNKLMKMAGRALNLKARFSFFSFFSQCR